MVLEKHLPVFSLRFIWIIVFLFLSFEVSSQTTIDTDGDGVEDSIDLDDDNDGLLDVFENNSCNNPSENNCDFDGDGIPNRLDLDDDNDGIPTVVELQLLDADKNASLSGLNWVDANGDGVDDNYGNVTNPIDSDADGVPDYLDLDSDNDTIFDVYEYDGLGDCDTSGNGIGNGTDSASGINDDDKDGDGILGVIDLNDDDADEFDFGSLNYPSPIDVDNDGIPNYLDIDADNNGIFDIEETIYGAYIPNENGVIMGTEDVDNDGILDVFDSNTYIIGSPRKLNGSYSIPFDGRNDYIEEVLNESEKLINGQMEFTLMAWIKLDSTFSNTGAIVGQNKFWLRINSSKRLSSMINNYYTLTAPSETALELNKWTHVAAVYDGNNSEETLKLFINGKKVISRNSNIQGGIQTSSNTNFRIGKKPANTTSGSDDFFKGEIDEVRVFSKALTNNELQKMVYQELDENFNFNYGKTIPLEISPNLQTHLLRYYKMDVINENVVDNLVTSEIDSIGAKVYNIQFVVNQTAPMPYETKAEGDWTSIETWKHGKVWDISNKRDSLNDCAIVHVKHSLTTSNIQSALGLLIDSEAEFSIKPSVGLYNNWYLKLDGILDLEGESQFIQTENSSIDSSSSGYLERDQQGTASSYNYNYWSSSVNVNFNNYQLSKVLLDGSKQDGIEGYPKNINFQSQFNAADGSLTNPVTTSTYWLWKFNGLSDDYNAWISIDENSKLLPGEGFTMKGTSGTALITDLQNYVFRGLPNNGTISLHVNLGNDRLVGNPYPSALDANEFILDNIKDSGGRANSNIFNGTIYFWHHFAGKTHYLSEYEGGYAAYNLTGGVQAYATDERINATGNGGLVIPERYIPLNQGFFVITSIDENLSGSTDITGGDIVFKNSQRICKVEGKSNDNSGSVFLKSNATVKNKSKQLVDDENVQRIWLQFSTSNGNHRQLLLGAHNNATDGFDIGFDAPLIDKNNTDMCWVVDHVECVIQGISNIYNETEIPIKITVQETAEIELKVDKTEGKTLPVFIQDKELGETYSISEKNSFKMLLESGEYENRFYLVFQPRLKTLEEVKLPNGFFVVMDNASKELQIQKIVDTQISTIQVFNNLGQQLKKWNNNLQNRHLSFSLHAVPGVYIVTITTTNGIVTKKMIVY